MVSFNIEKIANAIIYFVNNDVESLGKTKLMKLLFYTDKYHLENFGRAVFGDAYYKLPQGPVPTITLNVINSLNESEKDDFSEYGEVFSKYVKTEETEQPHRYKAMKFIPQSEFNEKLFSKSELKVMDDVIAKFKDYTARQISDESHETPEYQEAYDTGIISEESMSGKNKDYVEYWKKEHNAFDSILHEQAV